MWSRKFRNNGDPFAGYMLMGYAKQDPLERAGREIDQPAEDVRRGGSSSTVVRKPSPPKRGFL